MTNPLTAAGASNQAKGPEAPAAVAAAALGLVALGLVAPGLAPLCIGFRIGNRGYAASKHRRFWLWLTPERWPLMAVSALSFTVVVAFTVAALLRMSHSAAPATLWPWLVASLAAGAAGAPAHS